MAWALFGLEKSGMPHSVNFLPVFGPVPMMRSATV